MKFVSILIILLSSLSFALPPYYNALADAMSKIFDDDFDSAIFICDSLSEQYPDDPSPAVFKIIAKSSRLQDVENDAGKEISYRRGN